MDFTEKEKQSYENSFSKFSLKESRVEKSSLRLTGYLNVFEK